ncbi:MAG: precorrin-6y C5,15-methyltransferase (decarboxylating) subunit CbiE [Spirochaetaceae bacterium]|nr:precorrin-6y C5,15-methyltransferase (decarboxylating) subunit CbiE [Spirochaetaceae bacterium]
MGKLIYIIGAGPGAQNLLTGEAREALAESEHIIGAERLLESLETLIKGKKKDALVAGEAIAEAIRRSANKTHAVLVTGDSGFFSLSKRLVPLLKTEAARENWEIKVLCGINSVSCLASKLNVAYDGAVIKSYHGRLNMDAPAQDKERLLNELAGLAARSRQCFFLTDKIVSPRLICGALAERGLDELCVSVGERLSYPDEKIISGKVNELLGRDFDSPNVVYIENGKLKQKNGVNPPVHSPVNPKDADFIRGAVPMTKEEVRAISLAKLWLKPEAVCWDLGAGTGSVSCAMALAVPYGRVYAVEKDAEAIELIKQNKEKFDCYNIKIIEGEAPAALADLPPPDSAFIGGSSGALRDIIREITGKNPYAHIVINAVTLETLNSITEIIAENHFPGAEIAQIGVNVFQKTGKYQLLRAQNPVFVISFGGEA